VGRSSGRSIVNLAPCAHAKDKIRLLLFEKPLLDPDVSPQVRLLARTLLCAALLGAGADVRGQGASLKTSESAAQLAASLDTLVPALLKDGDVPGLSLAVVRGGRMFWHRSWGVKDAATGAPIDDETIFEAASLSKPVFAYAVMKLVDQGVIDLDTPIVRYLPGDYASDPRIRLVTPRNALSHTAGFPNWRDGRELKMYTAPGERFSYSGEGFMYLQKAVENVTGQTLDAVMKRLVFVPLAMTSSSYTWKDRFDGRKATGHDDAGAPQPIKRPTSAESAATLQTTLADYARFLAAVLDGTGLKKKTWNEMLRPQIFVDEGCLNCVTGTPTGRLSSEVGWGLGWGLQQTADGTSIWHWGDNGDFHCYVVGYPRERAGLIIFTNGAGGHGIIPDVIAAAIGGRQPALAMIGYERWDSPSRVFLKDVLARGDGAVRDYETRVSQDPGAALSETQVNRVGYWLLGRKRPKEAVAVLALNVARFPKSWNAYDSIAEAYAAAGEPEKAIASSEKSLALNPENGNGVEQLKKLRAGAPAP
jgi:CubicO group peptidase (beta-lactamase class C family)